MSMMLSESTFGGCVCSLGRDYCDCGAMAEPTQPSQLSWRWSHLAVGVIWVGTCMAVIFGVLP
jgi:hypothetical protein